MGVSVAERLRLKKSPFVAGKVLVGVSRDSAGNQNLLYLDYGDLNLHTQILGTTGTGKTQLIISIVSQCIWNNWPVFVIDNKGDEDLFKAMWAASCICGREKNFRYLNPSAFDTERGLVGDRGSHSYNPLVGIRGVTATTDALFKANQHKSNTENPFWSKMEKEILDTLVRCFESTGKTYSPKDMWICLESQDALKLLAKENKDEESQALVEKWVNNLSDYSSAQKQEERFQSAKMFLRDLGTGTIGKMLNSYEPDVSVKSTYRDNLVTLCALNSLKQKEVGKSIGKLVLAELLSVAGDIIDTTTARSPFIVVIDEFENFVYPGVEAGFDKGRGTGLALLYAHQNPYQIDLDHSAEMRRVISGNARNKFFLGFEDFEAAELSANLIGKDATALSFNFDGFGLREADLYKVSPEVITTMKNFQYCLRKQGELFDDCHVIRLPNDWQLGSQIPKPRFTPSLSRENGIRIWERCKR